MPTLEIKNDCLTISLGWFAGMYWPSRKITISRDTLEKVYIDNKRPFCLLCRKPVANLLSLLSMGVFYPNGYSQKSELWWFTYKHKALLNIVLKHGSHEKIVLGMGQEQAAKWLEKINDLMK